MNIEAIHNNAIKAFENTPVAEIIKNEHIAEDSEIPKRVLKSEKRETYVPEVLKKLTQFQKEEWAIQLAIEFKRKYPKYGKGLSQDLQKDCEKILALFKDTIAEKAAEKPKVQPCDDFAGEWRTIAALKKQLESPENIVKLFLKVKHCTEVFEQKQTAASKNFDKTDKEIDPHSIGVSLFKLENRESYLLGGCPKTIEEAQNTFDVILKEGAPVLISLHQPHEIKNKLSFWANNVLSKLKLRNGWKIENMTEKELANTEKKENEDSKFQIVESTLLATRNGEKRTLHHFHYIGWENHELVPRLDLMNSLLDQSDKLSPSCEKPIWINCKGGVGRTGTVALARACRCAIQEQLKQGTKFEDVKINIPLLLYHLREKRAGLLSVAENFVNVYKAAVDYADTLNKGHLASKEKGVG